MEKTGGLSARIKGGGGIGITGGGQGDGESHASPSRPYPPGIHPGGKILKFLMPAFPVLCILYTQTLYLYIFLPYFHLK